MHATLEPALNDDTSPDIKPWAWYSGRTLRSLSLHDKSIALAVLIAEWHMLECVNGTAFGREVVPEVGKTNASSLS
jgi:hypothetical protein